MSKLFFLNGIKAPGRVNAKDLGEVNLEDLTDDQAMKLYKEGCPYLVPSPEGFNKLYPGSAPIAVSKLGNQKPARRKPRKK
jgi:hypothetical protein